MKFLVCIPTYNEAENIERAVRSVLGFDPRPDVLVIDDASPDGTAAIVAELAADEDRVHLLNRTAKDGLGGAYLAGFAWAKERGYDAVGEFDADGSHPADRLSALLNEIESGAELVIGSRWVRGGEVVDWPRRRKLLSVGGNIYTQAMLGLGVRDATSGYRVYRMSLLDRMDLGSVVTKGYGFQVDLTRRAVAAGARPVELPITFIERELGESKMSGEIVKEAMSQVTRWGIEKRLRRRVGRSDA